MVVPNDTMVLNVKPHVGKFSNSAGRAIHHIYNLTHRRMAFKVKCTNNRSYRVRPVYGFVEAKATTVLEIRKLKGKVKRDQFIIQYAEVPMEERNPKAPFIAKVEAGEVILPVQTD